MLSLVFLPLGAAYMSPTSLSKPLRSASSPLAACTVLQSADCVWSWRAGRCEAEVNGVPGWCLAKSCDFLTCECERAPPPLLPPRQLLNVSVRSCPDAIQRAFVQRAMQLHPDKNPGCRALASSELGAALRARDTMISMATWLQRGDACNAEDGGGPRVVEDGVATGIADRGRAPVAHLAWKHLSNEAKYKWTQLKRGVGRVVNVIARIVTNRLIMFTSVVVLYSLFV